MVTFGIASLASGVGIVADEGRIVVHHGAIVFGITAGEINQMIRHPEINKTHPPHSVC